MKALIAKILGEKRIKVRILCTMSIGGMYVQDGFIEEACFGGFIISNGCSRYYGELTPEGKGVFPNGSSPIMGWAEWEFADKRGVLRSMDDEAFRRFQMSMDQDEKAIKAFVREP